MEKRMQKEITIQDLVNKVKSDLFSVQSGTGNEVKKIYPLFFVDQVEIEIDFELTDDAEAGIKISIPQIVEGSVSGGQASKQGNKMKIILSPILSKEELRELMKEDERMIEEIKKASLMALRKDES
jgi:hypothetical protein